MHTHHGDVMLSAITPQWCPKISHTHKIVSVETLSGSAVNGQL